MTDSGEEQVDVGKSDIYTDDFERNAVARALGMDSFREIKKNQDQIQRLIDWAHAKGAKDYMDVAHSIQQLRNQVGSPPLGLSMAKHLSTYAYLEMERLRIDGELRAMEPKLPKSNDKETDTEGV